MEKFDTIIIGAGPAGLTASIYSVRAGKKVLVLAGDMIGGQASLSSVVENYPGFEKITGVELAMKMYSQASNLGATIVYEKAINIKYDNKIFEVATPSSTFFAHNIILSMGAKARHLGIPAEEKFVGRGVGYCAICDGGLYKGKDVVIVGGGDSAVEDTIYLSNLVNKVTMIVRKGELKCQHYLFEELMRAKEKGNIEIVYNANVVDILGDNVVSSVKLDNGQTISCQGVFIAIGRIPDTDLVKDLVELDKGYIVLLAYSPLGNKDDLDQSMHQFLISVIDSLMFTTQRGSYFNPGPVTTFSFPRTTPSGNISEDFSQESPEGSPETSPQNKEAVTLSINGTEVHTAIYPQDIEAQEFVIEREFAVLNLYAGTDLAISAWTRYYNQIYRCSFASLEEASFAIFARLREKDSVKNAENKDLALAQELLTWTQNFTYKRDTQSTDFSSPTAVLAGKTFSDCDSRSLLLAILLHQMNYKTLMFLSPVHQHAMLGIAIDAPGAKMAVNNTNYLVGETTAPVAIGLIAKDISVITDWIPVVFPE